MDLSTQVKQFNRVGLLAANPEDKVHGGGCAPESAEASGALGAVTVTVEGYLNHGLRNRNGGAGQRARLDLPVEFLGCCAREPIEFEAFALGEPGIESGERIGNLLFVLVDEGLAEGEEEP